MLMLRLYNKFRFTALLAISPIVVQAQSGIRPQLIHVNVTAAMNLTISPSPTSSAQDFNFLEGKWKVSNKMLRHRLSNSTQWDEFESTLHMKKVLNGSGNVENYYATFDGKAFEGLAVRLFNPTTRLWTVYWIDTKGMVMDQHPVIGSFENNIGRFYANDSYNGQAIIVLYQWDATDPAHPVWSQAFSTDSGKTWEINWEMKLTPIQ